MIKFPLDPQICVILNAFNKSSTLREAASFLGIDPPALVRKAQKIAEDTDCLQKVGNRWALTETGIRVAQWTDEIIVSQLNLLNEQPRLRIACFTWLAEEMLIPQLHQLTDLLSNKYQWSFNMTAGNLEQELMQSRSDFVITGHAPNDPTIAHKKIASYPWVVIVPFSWKRSISGLNENEIIEFLKLRPFIRHAQVNPEQTLGFAPTIISNIMVDGVIGLRSSVVNDLGWTVVPAMSIQSCINNRKVLKLDLKTSIIDHVSVWWLRSRKDTAGSARYISKWISQFRVL